MHVIVFFLTHFVTTYNNAHVVVVGLGVLNNINVKILDEK